MKGVSPEKWWRICIGMEGALLLNRKQLKRYRWLIFFLKESTRTIEIQQKYGELGGLHTHSHTHTLAAPFHIYLL